MPVKKFVASMFALVACSTMTAIASDAQGATLNAIAGNTYHPGEAACVYRDSNYVSNHCNYTIRYELPITLRTAGAKTFTANTHGVSSSPVTCWVRTHNATGSQTWFSGTQTTTYYNWHNLPMSWSRTTASSDVAVFECDIAPGVDYYGIMTYPKVYNVSWTD